MRNAKSGGINRTRIRARLGACTAVVSFIVFVVVLSAAICCGLNLCREPSVPPITFAILAPTNSVSGTGLTHVLVTNAGQRRYNCAVETEVLINGSWHCASGQHSDSEITMRMPPTSQQVLSLPTPQEGHAWRLKLVAGRTLGEAERKVEWLCRRIRLDYPFGEHFQMTGQAMMNRSVETSQSPLIVRLDQEL